MKVSRPFESHSFANSKFMFLRSNPIEGCNFFGTFSPRSKNPGPTKGNRKESLKYFCPQSSDDQVADFDEGPIGETHPKEEGTSFLA